MLRAPLTSSTRKLYASPGLAFPNESVCNRPRRFFDLPFFLDPLNPALRPENLFEGHTLAATSGTHRNASHCGVHKLLANITVYHFEVVRFIKAPHTASYRLDGRLERRSLIKAHFVVDFLLPNAEFGGKFSECVRKRAQLESSTGAELDSAQLDLKTFFKVESSIIICPFECHTCSRTLLFCVLGVRTRPSPTV